MPDPHCEHTEFKSSVAIQRVKDDATGQLKELRTNVVIVCKNCGRQFHPQKLNDFGQIELYPEL